METSLAQLKTTMQMDVLHCKTVPGVLKPDFDTNRYIVPDG